MDIKYLDTFVKVTELKSFTLAAERLGLTQPGVSKQIQRLEAEVGASLFRRSDGDLSLTEVGQAVYQTARSVLSDWANLQARCQQYEGPLSGELVIGASSIPGKHFLPQIVAAFTRAYPSVQLQVRIGDSTAIEEALASGNVSIALIGRKPESAALTAHPIGSDRLVIVAPKDFPLESDWRQGKFIFREQGSGTHLAAQAALAAIDVLADGLHAPIHVNDTALILNLVRLGLGMAVLSELDALEAVALGQARIVHAFTEERHFYLTQYREYLTNPLVVAFTQTVYKTLGIEKDASKH